ncbi:MAG: serine protease [Bauldia sp.]|nr:serine protease [Bauldia sp.]
MGPEANWQVTPAFQPDPKDFAFDLDAALSSVVSIRSTVPEDAFTAGVLGTERSGAGVLIERSGLVLTVGYLITEAETIWLGLSDGRTVPGHALGYDQVSGFGLVQALARLDVQPLSLGSANELDLGTRVVVGGAGGRARSVGAYVVGRQEFAGYWEYLLEDAIFTAPAHPVWGGAALIGPTGKLCGIASLRLEQTKEQDGDDQLNMIIPIDLLPPVLDDLKTTGHRSGAVRPWLGVYAVEMEERVVVAGLAEGGPAERAGLASGDMILAVSGTEVSTLAAFYRRLWALGAAGVSVPLTVFHDGAVIDILLESGDRNRFLKVPALH